MTTTVGDLVANLRLDMAQFSRGLSTATGDLEDFATKVQRVGSRAVDVGRNLTAGVSVPVVGAGVAAAKAASDTEQAMGAIETVLGGAAGEVKKFASTSAASYGISESAALQMGAQTAAMLQSLGFDAETAASNVVGLTKTGADLAAAFGGKPVDAVEAINAALRGEFDTLEKYGVSVKAADVANRLAAKGMDDLTGSALKQAQAQEVLNMINDQTAKVQGQAAREADTTAGRMARLGATVSDLAADFGAALLPTVERFAGVAQRVIDWLDGLDSGTRMWVVGVAAAAAAIGPLVAGVGLLISGAAALAPVLAAVTLPMLAIPAAIAGVVAAVMWLWNTNEGFRDAVRSAWAGIQSAIGSAVEFLTAAIGAFVDWARGWWAEWGDDILGTARTTWEQVQAVVASVTDAIAAAIEVFTDVAEALWRTWGSTIVAVGRRFFDVLQNLVENVWGGIKNTISGVLNVVRGVFEVFAGLFTGDWSRLWEGVKQIAVGLWQTLVGAWQGIVNSVVDILHGLVAGAGRVMGDLVARLTGPLVTLAGDFVDMGADLVRGIWNGISGMGSWLAGRVRNWAANTLPGPVADLLGISSPSKLFAEMGRDTVRGMALGIDRNAVMATRAAERLAAGVQVPAQVNAPVALPSPTGARGGVGIGANGSTYSSMNVTVELDGRVLSRVLGKHLVDDIRLRGAVRTV